MNFLCPSCRTPLPRTGPEQVTCTGCGVAVDLTRVETAPGQARLWPEIDLSGETLGGYALVRLLGSGGMGSVYEARAPDGGVVALKVLAPLLAAEPALRERFRREARALATLKHPGVVAMLGEGEERSFCWYSMERVDGVDLRERLKLGPMPAREVISLATAMLDALDAVHSAGFVHRDVKPSNILLSPSGPKLCDFGIARFEGANTLTESAALLGSLRYMAPEQRWGKSDARSDLYALGVVLHEALALGVPGERSLPPGTPAALARVIATLTEASPTRRPVSAAAAKRMLVAPPARTAQLVAAALLFIGAGGTYLLLGGLQLGSTAVADAGTAVTKEAVDDAGASLALLPRGDAPTAKLEEPRDAGSAQDAGDDARAAKVEAPRDAGPGSLTMSGALGTGTLGTAGPKTKKRLSKPAPEKIAKELRDTPTEKPATDALGTVVVRGTGAASVVIDGVTRGAAPGRFDVGLGGHVVFVRCDSSGKKAPQVHTFKVFLSGEAPTKELDYACGPVK